MKKSKAKRVISAISAFVLALVFVLTLASCGALSESELKELVPKIEKSREILEAVYGKGLETDADIPTVRNYYRAVKDTEKYTTVDSITTDMKEVFTSSYTGVLCITAFRGITVPEGVVRARYIEEEGRLYSDIEYVSQVNVRTPDYDSMKVLKANRYMAEIEIDMVNTDGTREKETFLVRFEDGAWKLDSAVL